MEEEDENDLNGFWVVTMFLGGGWFCGRFGEEFSSWFVICFGFLYKF